MRKDFHCPYSVLNADIICEHKSARIDLPRNVTLHNHDGYELVLFLNGNLSLFVESVEKKMERGDLVLIPPYTFHGLNLTVENADILDHYERIVLNIRPQLLQKISDEATNLSDFLAEKSSDKFSMIHLNDDTLEQFINCMDKLEAAIKDNRFGSSLLSKAVLTEFLISLAHYSHQTKAKPFTNNMPRAVSAIFEIIDDNISNELTVEIIAEKLHHNSDYIGRIFKQTTGGSLKHYINAKKISLAQQYLSQGYSPSDVCFMVGYENYSSFSRRFSEQIGLSPKQYQIKSSS